MPDVSDYPFRPWSSGFSLGFGPLFFEPPRPPEETPSPVTGAKGSSVRILGDRRPGSIVRRVE